MSFFIKLTDYLCLTSHLKAYSAGKILADFNFSLAIQTIVNYFSVGVVETKG